MVFGECQSSILYKVLYKKNLPFLIHYIRGRERREREPLFP